MENEFKEVYFHQYCRTCEYCTQMEELEPCSECLKNPVNLNSHKPVKWKEARRS